MNNEKLNFASDYTRGAHPALLNALVQANDQYNIGYGCDAICDDAKDKIRAACAAPDAAVHFLVGGTQTNAVVIDALLRPWQGVVSAQSAHIAVHEAGAIEACGHKVLTLPQHNGKLDVDEVRGYIRDFFADDNWEHIVEPGMVYISQPTEYGTLYSRAELSALHDLCREYDIPLYVDGARLAYALAAPENDVSLPDLAALCDAFYIGGTKCGALFGEAVVIPDGKRLPRFFTEIKRHGALLAKGWLLGLQFGTMFTDNLYDEIGRTAIDAARRLTAALKAGGYRLYLNSPTNQIFVVMPNSRLQALAERVVYGFIEKFDDEHTVIRFCTSWATRSEDVDALIDILCQTEQ